MLREKNIEVSVPAISMARRRIEHLRSENAAVSFVRILCSVSGNVTGETLKLAFRTLSMARQRIERLQGVQFCRRTMEIRSEVSRPPDLFRAA